MCPPPGTHWYGNQLEEAEEGLLGARLPNQRESEYQEDIIQKNFVCRQCGVFSKSANLRELEDIPKSN